MTGKPNITRRDFLNGIALGLAAGGTLSPLEIMAMSANSAGYPPALAGLRGSHPHYPVGWAMAGNTPLKYYKQSAHEGGIRGPLLVTWPKGITARGAQRSQFHHGIDQ